MSGASDAWVPVLTTRLVEGRVWFTGGLSVDDVDFAWKQLVTQIKYGKCVPILGSGLLEPFVGSTRELANRLAAANGYPMALSGREDLPQVAQFLKTIDNAYLTRMGVVKEMAEAVRRRWPELNLPPASDDDPAADLRVKLVAAWRAYQQDRPFEPHRYLAGVRQIKKFITTNPDDLMEESLKAAGRLPRVVICRWDGAADDIPPESEPAPGPLRRPTPGRTFTSSSGNWATSTPCSSPRTTTSGSSQR